LKVQTAWACVSNADEHAGSVGQVSAACGRKSAPHRLRVAGR
jgi:hypothetical protein